MANQHDVEMKEQMDIVASMSSEATYKKHLKDFQIKMDVRVIHASKDRDDKQIKAVEIRAKAIPQVQERIDNAKSLIPLKRKAHESVSTLRETLTESSKVTNELALKDKDKLNFNSAKAGAKSLAGANAQAQMRQNQLVQEVAVAAAEASRVDEASFTAQTKKKETKMGLSDAQLTVKADKRVELVDAPCGDCDETSRKTEENEAKIAKEVSKAVESGALNAKTGDESSEKEDKTEKEAGERPRSKVKGPVMSRLMSWLSS